MPTYLLLDPSSINALTIIALLFEILTLLRVVRSLDSIFYEAVLNNAYCDRCSPKVNFCRSHRPERGWK